MNSTWEEWLVVWLADGTRLNVSVHEEPRVSAAVQAWIDSARSRDTVLCMDGLGGRTVNYLASQIVGWMISTPEYRASDAAEEARARDETRSMRQQAGLPYESDE